jgi:hypothetical protein
MATAALALNDATGHRQYIEDAVTFADLLETWHLSDDGTYRLAGSDAGDVVIRMRSGLDEATPNPNGTAASLLVRLYHLTGEHRFIERADRLISAFASDAAQNPVGYASLLSALSLRTHGTQIVIIGDPDDPQTKALVSAANRVPDPNRSLTILSPGNELPEKHPAAGKTQVDGRATAYICQGETCSLPIADASDIAARLKSVSGSSRS